MQDYAYFGNENRIVWKLGSGIQDFFKLWVPHGFTRLMNMINDRNEKNIEMWDLAFLLKCDESKKYSRSEQTYRGPSLSAHVESVYCAAYWALNLINLGHRIFKLSSSAVSKFPKCSVFRNSRTGGGGAVSKQVPSTNTNLIRTRALTIYSINYD